MNIRAVGRNIEKIFITYCKPLTRYGPLSGEVKRNQENCLSLLGVADYGILGNIKNYIVNFIKKQYRITSNINIY